MDDIFDGLGDFEISEEVAEEFVQCELALMNWLEVWLNQLVAVG